MAKSKEYWEKRFELLEDAQTRKGAEYFSQLEKQYRKATIAVQKDVERWLARLADNNELTLQGARKLLNNDELEEFKWNVMDYIEKGRTLNFSDEWAKQLENASVRWHISRLEAIKVQMQNHAEVLYATELDDISRLMSEVYTEGYYHTAYEIQKGFNIGYDLMKLDGNKIEKVLSKPWAADGSNFSSRIWKHKSQLVNELHNNLTQAIIRGQNPKVVTDTIAKRFNVSKGQAGRLVMTETAFFHSASTRDCYKDLGVEQYEILATLDKHTSDICQGLDGKVFKLSDYAVGVTAPPFHQWCRTTTVPYFDDEFELDAERAARDENGKTYYVPANMKYPEWKKTFVDGGSKEELTPIVDIPENAEETDTSERVRQGTPMMNDGDVLSNNKDITEYKNKKKEYDTAVSKMNELDKESDKLLDDYMLGMDTDKAEELNKKFEAKFVEAEEYKKYVEEVKQKLSQTESRAVKAIEEEFAKLVGVDKSKINLEGLTYESAEIWYRKTDSILQKFPQIKDNITTIKYDVSKTKGTDAGTKPLSGEVYIGKPFNNYRQMLKDYAEDVASGYSPQGTNASSVITHEFGHLLDGYLTKTHKAGLVNQYGVNYASDELVNDILKDMNITTKEGIFKDVPFKERLEVREKWITENISKYASRNNKEAFAELFAEYVDSPNPRTVALELGKRVEKLLGNGVIEESLEDIVEETTKITKKKYNSNYGIVDRKLVNSKTYHDKFEGLTKHKAVNESIYQESMKMLEHRDNTPYEDLIVIDSNSGKVVARFTESTKPGKVSLTAEQADIILKYDGNVILLHNHPNGSRASYTDIKNLKVKNIEATIAAGHDGSVYYVSDLDSGFDIDIFWDEVYNSYKDIYKDDVLASHYATDDLYDLRVFKVESR